MPCVTLRDRRAGGQPMVRFVFQRHLESALYRRAIGSSGPIWKLLNATGMGATALQVSKVSVTNELLTQSEFEQLMTLFKQHVPSDVTTCSQYRNEDSFECKICYEQTSESARVVWGQGSEFSAHFGPILRPRACGSIRA